MNYLRVQDSSQYSQAPAASVGEPEAERLSRALEARHPTQEKGCPEAAVAGLAARLVTAYAKLPERLAGLHDERLGLAQLATMRPALQRGKPALVHPDGLIGELVFAELDAPLAEDDRQPGLFEEELAAAIVAAHQNQTGEGLAASASRLAELPHHPAALRFCIGLACLQLVPSLSAQDLRRDLFRRGQFCLVNAHRARTSRLLRVLHASADPWISTEAPIQGGEARQAGVPSAAERASGCADEGVEHLSGTVLRLRDHKRILFADLAGQGSVRQIAIPKDFSREHGLDKLKAGDRLTVRGTAKASRSGEPTVFVEEVESLRPGSIPSLGPPPSRLEAHAAVLALLRAQLGELGFLEQSTPTLSESYEGGTARPYMTWVNQRSQPAYLRVTSELALIKSLASGLRRCYEIGSSFRNESHAGSLTGHYEFLLAEAYATDMTLDEMTDFAVKLTGLCALGDSWDGAAITVPFDEAVSSVTGVECEDEKGVMEVLAQHVGPYAATRSFPRALQILLDEVLAPAFNGIVVFTEPPLPASPLTAGDGRDAARRWVYAEGVDCAEIAGNEDDVEVIARDLERQHAGDSSCVPRDYTQFLHAIAALPGPPVGMGMGVSRLIDVRDGIEAPCHVL